MGKTVSRFSSNIKDLENNLFLYMKVSISFNADGTERRFTIRTGRILYYCETWKLKLMLKTVYFLSNESMPKNIFLYTHQGEFNYLGLVLSRSGSLWETRNF